MAKNVIVTDSVRERVGNKVALEAANKARVGKGIGNILIGVIRKANTIILI